MQTDYLIIGQGIAGTVLGYSLLKKGCSIIVVSDDAPNAASRVAAGLYNPVTGKRMSKTWKAAELFPFSESFYKEFEKDYSCTIVHPMPIFKPFANIEEQNTWLSTTEAEAFVNTDIPAHKYDAYINQHIGGFETKHSGFIDLPVMLDTFRERMIQENRFLSEVYDPSKLSFSDTEIQYGDISARKIIFCEGTRATSNPLFSWLPFVPSKGEVVKVKVENFTEETIFNKQVFIIPLGNGLYRVGSTYQWVFESGNPTEKGLEEISGKLAGMIRMPFTVTEHKAGIRPSVKDRKPIVGFHPEHPAIAIFNGLGTKGVSLAPYFAENFALHLEQSKQLSPEVNIERFYSLYSRSEN